MSILTGKTEREMTPRPDLHKLALEAITQELGASTPRARSKALADYMGAVLKKFLETGDVDAGITYGLTSIKGGSDA